MSFEFSDGRALTKKIFQFMQKSYLVQVTSQVTQNGMLFRTRSPGAAASAIRRSQSRAVQHALYYDLPNSKLKSRAFERRQERPGFRQRPVFLRRHRRQLFRGVFLPGDKPSVELTTFSDAVPNADGKDEKRVGAAWAATGSTRFRSSSAPRIRTCCAR